MLEGRVLQGEIGIPPLEAVVLVFQFFRSLHVRGVEAAVLSFPFVVGRGADPVRPPQL